MDYNPEEYSNNENLNKEIFELFDQDGSGKLDIKDLEDIGRALGWKRDRGNAPLSHCLSERPHLLHGPEP